MKNFDLLHALSQTDENLIERAAASMAHHTLPQKVSPWKRIGLLSSIAAGLAVVIALGALMTPILMSNSPDDTSVGSQILQSSQGVENVKNPQSPAIIQMISISEATPNQGQTQNYIMSENQRGGLFGNGSALISFDLQPGESVALTTFWETLAVREYPTNHRYLGNLDPAVLEDRAEMLQYLAGTTRVSNSAFMEREVAFDVNESYAVWTGTYPNTSSIFKIIERVDNVIESGRDIRRQQILLDRYNSVIESTWSDDYDGVVYDENEDILSYVIRDAQGEIVAVGAMYAHHHHLMDEAYAGYTHYDRLYVTRYADLGYMRFDSPITEVAAENYLKEMYQKIPEVKANMDFTPVGDSEFYAAGLADLLQNVNFERPEEDCYTTSGIGHSSVDNFVTFHIGYVPKTENAIVDASHADYVYRIYNDGTWEEVTDEYLGDEADTGLQIGEQEIKPVE